MNIISLSEARAIGLTYYFTGKPCKNGHISKRFVSTRYCKSCHQERYAKSKLSADFMEKERARQRSEKYRATVNAQRSTDSGRLARERYIEKNRESINAYRRERYASNKDFRCAVIMRAFMQRVIRGSKGQYKKRCRCFEVLGYTSADLAKHIESQFKDGMHWGNHGEWHIDHIAPVAKMLSDGIVDPAVINSLENLQPLWAEENLRKSKK